MRVTVDASVAIKWFVAEPRHKEAHLLRGHRIERFAPSFLLVECTNVLWKKVRRGEIADLAPYFEELSRLREVLSLHSTEDLLADAAQLAVDLRHPVYDCLYIACAKRTESALVTDDRRLARAVLEHLPELEVLSLHDQNAIRTIEAAAVLLN